MKTRFLLILAFLCLLPAVDGCGFSTSSTVRLSSSADPNFITTLRGKAADTYAEHLSDVDSANKLTPRGQLFQMTSELKKLLPFLVLISIGGTVFWALTRSKTGWIIPAAAATGVTVILVIGRYAELITGSVVIIAIALLAYKAIQYQRERNNAGSK